MPTSFNSLRLTLLTGLFCPLIELAGEKPAGADKPDAEQIEAVTRLQIFLDQANFGPGKIDGRMGEFTRKALELYRQSRGLTPVVPSETPADPEPKENDELKDELPDVSDIQDSLAKIDPVFMDYTVTEQDADAVGTLRDGPKAQAEQKWLPYASLAEAVAERFHCDLDYLRELNPKLAETLKVGDTVRVPSVAPFELRTAADLDRKEEESDENEGKGDDDDKTETDAEQPEPGVELVINKRQNMLQVLSDGKLIAAFPTTVGSAATETPDGDWHVKSIARLPNFRYDRKMLKAGERSYDYHLLPPGPNNPVGIVWIALNKDGIGIHGTDSPDTIGRASSHGCIRLANWDADKLVGMITPQVKVRIE